MTLFIVWQSAARPSATSSARSSSRSAGEEEGEEFETPVAAALEFEVAASTSDDFFLFEQILAAAY